MWFSWVPLNDELASLALAYNNHVLPPPLLMSLGQSTGRFVYALGAISSRRQDRKHPLTRLMSMLLIGEECPPLARRSISYWLLPIKLNALPHWLWKWVVREELTSEEDVHGWSAQRKCRWLSVILPDPLVCTSLGANTKFPPPCSTQHIQHCILLKPTTAALSIHTVAQCIHSSMCIDSVS